MPFDAHANFATSTVAVAPSPLATTGTSLAVAPGDGALFPAPPFNAVVFANTWPEPLPLKASAEVVRVTARVGDTFTIVRGQEATTARYITAGDVFANNITVKALTDIEAAVTVLQGGAPVHQASLVGAVSLQAPLQWPIPSSMFSDGCTFVPLTSTAQLNLDVSAGTAEVFCVVPVGFYYADITANPGLASGHLAPTAQGQALAAGVVSVAVPEMVSGTIGATSVQQQLTGLIAGHTYRYEMTLTVTGGYSVATTHPTPPVSIGVSQVVSGAPDYAFIVATRDQGTLSIIRSQHFVGFADQLIGAVNLPAGVGVSGNVAVNPAGTIAGCTNSAMGATNSGTFVGNTHTSTTVDGIASTAGLYAGMAVTGSGIQAATTIALVLSATSVQLSLPTTTTVAGVTVSYTYGQIVSFVATGGAISAGQTQVAPKVQLHYALASGETASPIWCDSTGLFWVGITAGGRVGCILSINPYTAAAVASSVLGTAATYLPVDIQTDNRSPPKYAYVALARAGVDGQVAKVDITLGTPATSLRLTGLPVNVVSCAFTGYNGAPGCTTANGSNVITLTGGAFTQNIQQGATITAPGIASATVTAILSSTQIQVSVAAGAGAGAGTLTYTSEQAFVLSQSGAAGSSTNTLSQVNPVTMAITQTLAGGALPAGLVASCCRAFNDGTTVMVVGSNNNATATVWQYTPATNSIFTSWYAGHPFNNLALGAYGDLWYPDQVGGGAACNPGCLVSMITDWVQLVDTPTGITVEVVGAN